MKAKLIAISPTGFVTHCETEADIDGAELLDKLRLEFYSDPAQAVFKAVAQS